MLLNNFNTDNRYTAKVIKSTRITAPESSEEVRELVLQFNAQKFVPKVGQSIGVIVPGTQEFGNEAHFRLYTIAGFSEKQKNKQLEITICVKRCSYIDDFSGEEFKGIASNYLCDLKAHDQLTITGPYGHPFEVPDERDADLLLIGLGTGIAPFRAFVSHIYHNIGNWQGKVRLFYGAKTGLEMLYMNDERDDFANYYDTETFKAFKAVSPRPHWEAPVALDKALQDHEDEVWNMICQSKTHVYVAGLATIKDTLDRVFSQFAGSEEKWRRKKAELVAGKRWVELIY